MVLLYMQLLFTKYIHYHLEEDEGISCIIWPLQDLRSQTEFAYDSFQT